MVRWRAVNPFSLGALGFESLATHQLDVSGFFDNLMTEVCSAWVWREHPALPARRDGFDTRRPNQGSTPL